MKYDLIENGLEVGGYTVDGEIVHLVLSDRILEIPMHCDCHGDNARFKDGKLFHVLHMPITHGIEETLKINRWSLWME